ncbi:MAG TPA: ATP-binding protein [Aggregatilineales bacterium]|nr:GAF domain-containing protein [Anaerolineales bacterium]HRE49603.1 ATP-binding protein [Aggregatilineales bacterium]
MIDWLATYQIAHTALETAPTVNTLAETLTNALHWLMGDQSEVRLWLGEEVRDGEGDMPAAAHEAHLTLHPQVAAEGREVAFPLNVDRVVHGLVFLLNPSPLSEAIIGLAYALSRAAAAALERLSYPASPEVFRQLVENANVAIDVAGLDGRITYANQAAALLYGYDEPSELIGKTVIELYFGDDEQRVAREIVLGSRSQAGWAGDVLQKDAAGNALPVRLAVFSIGEPGQGLTGYGGIAQSLGEQQRLLLSLRQQTQRLRAAAQVAQAAVSKLDLDSLLLEAASVAQQLFHYNLVSVMLIEEDALHIKISYTEKGVLLPRNGVLALDETSLNGWVGTHGRSILITDVSQDARCLTLEGMPEAGCELVVPLRMGDRVIGTLDVQNAKPNSLHAEDLETMESIATHLSLAIENARLYRDALEANEMKSQFLATMSHELRTPLNAILGYTEMVLSGMYGALSDKQADRLRRVYVNAQHLLELINDVLDLARIESGRLNLHFDAIDVPLLMSRVLSNITPLAEAKRLALEAIIPDTLPLVRADEVRLRQIVINLMSNAVKFTREGRISLRIAIVRTLGGDVMGDSVPGVDFSTAELPDGEHMVFVVEDTGIGIASEYQAMIFDAFRQVDNSPIREYQGTGLGLAISRQLVELHGGSLWVHSQLGEGATFVFALPLTTTEEAE